MTVGTISTVTPFTRVGGAEVFTIRDLHVIEDRIIHPDGTPGQYVYTRRGDYGVTVVAVAAIGGVDHVAMVRQHRYPVNDVVLELPGGGADILTAENAARELEEETTLIPESIKFLGSFYQAPGNTTTVGSSWLARVTAVNTELRYVEPESGAVTEWYSIDQVRQLMADGGIRCGVTLAALSIAFAGGHLN